MKSSTTAQRLKQLMDERGMTQNDILLACRPYANANHIKLGKSILSQYISGTIEPGQWKLAVLAQGLGVSETWLMGYDEDEDDKDELLEQLRQSPETRMLFDAAKGATAEQIKQAAEILKVLKGQQ